MDARPGGGCQGIFEVFLRDTVGANEKGAIDAGFALEISDARELPSGAGLRDGGDVVGVPTGDPGIGDPELVLGVLSALAEKL